MKKPASFVVVVVVEDTLVNPEGLVSSIQDELGLVNPEVLEPSIQLPFILGPFLEWYHFPLHNRSC